MIFMINLQSLNIDPMKSKILLVGTAAVLMAFSVNGQGLVGKLKQKAAGAAERALDKKTDEKSGTNTDDQQNSNSENSNGSQNTSGNNPSNKTGGGLVSTPPDVNQNLSDAEA